MYCLSIGLLILLIVPDVNPEINSKRRKTMLTVNEYAQLAARADDRT